MHQWVHPIPYLSIQNFPKSRSNCLSFISVVCHSGWKDMWLMHAPEPEMGRSCCGMASQCCSMVWAGWLLASRRPCCVQHSTLRQFFTLAIATRGLAPLPRKPSESSVAVRCNCCNAALSAQNSAHAALKSILFLKLVANHRDSTSDRRQLVQHGR